MNSTKPPQARWRTLSTEELAANPDAKLGGALAVMFWGALAMLTTVVLMLAVMIVFGDFFSVTMMSRMLFSASTLSSRIAGIQMIPQAIFALWALVFAIMTLSRRHSTPSVASVLMIIWSVSSISAAIATRYLAARGSFDIFSQASLLPYIFLEIVLMAAFCGYMSDGRRPNAYYRRRVRA
jgi:hypothetical protein